MAVSSSPYDTDRFGAALPRFSPRQSDLLMVVGTVTHKQAPVLLKVYEQMCEPKWVMAFGACATSGGFYQNYAALPGIDRIIPVDIYVPGCPPRPETVIDAIMQLQDRIARCAPSDPDARRSDAWPRRRSTALRSTARARRIGAGHAIARLAGARAGAARDRCCDACGGCKDELRLRSLARRHRRRLARRDARASTSSTTSIRRAHFAARAPEDARRRGGSGRRLADAAVRLGAFHGARVPRHVRHRVSRQRRPAPDPALRGLRRPSAAQGLSEAARAAARALPRR